MSSLGIRIDVPGMQDGAVVPVELINLETRKTMHAVAQAGATTQVPVEPGPLFVQAVLSDGRLLTGDVEPGPDPTVVLGSAEAPPPPGPPDGYDSYADAWGRLWLRATSSWKPATFQPLDVVPGPELCWRMTLPAQQLHVLQVDSHLYEIEHKAWPMIYTSPNE
jgi:hypothetical protein